MVNQAEPFDENDNPVLYTDRTAIETDDTCGMKFWWNRKEGGLGIVSVDEADALRIGAEIHEDFAIIADLDDLSQARITELVEFNLSLIPDDDKVVQKRMEEAYRRMGWFAAYAIFIEPKIREVYENVSCESEIILDRMPLWIAVTPDRVLRHRKEGYLVYREYKSTISSSGKWMNSWTTSLQLHLGLKALEEELQEEIKFAQVVGLMKGEYRGRLIHPYVWAYRNESTGEWTSDYNKARSSAWHPAPIWEYPGGLVDWVVKLGPEVAVGMFPNTPPVFLNERVLDAVILARTAREEEIRQVENDCRVDRDLRNIFFPMRLKSCTPPYGDPCPYRAACYNASINEHPIASGLYKERVPHHTIELTLVR